MTLICPQAVSANGAVDPLKDFNFSEIPLKPVSDGKSLRIYDSLRKQHILLTPEEEVRQKLIWYLIHTKNIAPGRIALERAIKINGMLKRFDLVVFNSDGQPFLAVECKSPAVRLTQDVLQQLAVYNLHLKAEYLMVSNGMHHMICSINFNTREIAFLEDLPF